MPPSALLRLLQRPGLLAAVLFAATMVVAAALAYQAAGAAASHRAAAEATLTHHATVAAWRLAREGRSWVSYGMNDASDRLNRAASSSNLDGPELISTVLAEKDCDCMSAGFARTVFRIALDGEPRLAAIGEPLSERAKDGLIAAARGTAADTARRGTNRSRWRVLPPGNPRLTRATDIALLWAVARPPRQEPRAVFGMIVQPEQLARPLAGALDAVEFFPPSLVPSNVADSVVHIEVSGPNGQPVFSAGRGTRAFVGTDTLGVSLGELGVTVAIDPAAAAFLLVGGLPPSRSATVAALLALAMALGAAALLLLRREQRLARLREDFVSGVSHELRTPLTQIRLLSELLRSNGFKTTEERDRATGVIHREALRLTSLVDNILEFSRLRHGSGHDVRAHASLADVVSELAESLQPLLDAQSARLELEITDDVRVAGRRDAVSRVLRNVVENAVKYGPRGQLIRLTLSHAGGTARLTVDDEGPGVPAHERARVWEPYYRLDRDRNAVLGGSGLGLSVVADLVRELGGRAWVEDAPGRGARFTVELPAADVREGAP